ncbi:MAG TPA: peptidylprolyl isomerase [Tepidisphaeraceae bacterium]|jgi:cyclophilin family peptidyl-prolyl cis-trans isomerase|nr:peptidylprolyl isomerase [Tepidisphaeraceae bacterium]
MSITAIAQVPDAGAAAGTPGTVDLNSFFLDPTGSQDVAFFNTTLGQIPVALTPSTTPFTVANFLNYVNSGAYNNSIFHRSVPGFIIQGGGYTYTSAATGLVAIPANPPVINEFGASNVRGTIAMAKLGTDPNSATSQFFFNEADNASNLDSQNGGFTVFGNVVGAAGLAVMDALAAVPVPTPGPLSSPFDAIPLNHYNASVGPQASNLLFVNSITLGSAAFTATSDAPSIATVSTTGNMLTYSPVGDGTAHITVTGTGADNQTATETFAVTVTGIAPPPPGTPALTPAATGALPASVVSGQKAKIQQVVSLSAGAAAVSQTEVVALSLSTTTTGAPGDFTIASARKAVKLKAGKHLSLKLAAGQISGNIPTGTYHVLISVTDPSGLKNTVNTGNMLAIVPPTIDLTGSFAKVPTTAQAGGKVSVQILVANNGNLTANGRLSITLSTSPDDQLSDATTVDISPAKLVHIKPGKPMKLTLTWTAGAAPATYHLIAQVDPTNTFGDTNPADNTFATTGVLTVS